VKSRKYRGTIKVRDLPWSGNEFPPVTEVITLLREVGEFRGFDGLVEYELEAPDEYELAMMVTELQQRLDSVPINAVVNRPREVKR
jgi:hypothetical protein